MYAAMFSTSANTMVYIYSIEESMELQKNVAFDHGQATLGDSIYDN